MQPFASPPVTQPVNMKVYFDLIGNAEVASDGKPLVEVKDSEGNVIAGLLGSKCKTIPDPNDEDEDNAVRKLDHLWFFEEINGDEPAEYKNFKKWQKNYFASFVKGLQKVRCQQRPTVVSTAHPPLSSPGCALLQVKKDRGDFKEGEDAKKGFQKRMKGIMAWVEAEFDNLTFYNLWSTTGDHGGKSYLCGQLFCW